MNCKTCQTELLPGEKFCLECRTPTAISSPYPRSSGSTATGPSSSPGYSTEIQHTSAPPRASIPQVELLEQGKADYDREQFEAALKKLERILELNKGRKKINERV